MKESRKPPRHAIVKPPTFLARVWQPHGWRLLLLWSVVLVAYSNSFEGGMVFDSARIVSQDVRIHAATPQNIRLILTREYWHNSAPSGLYRPLTTFSYLS